MFSSNSFETPIRKQTQSLKVKLKPIIRPPDPRGRRVGRFFVNKCRYGSLTLGVGIESINQHVKDLSKQISEATLQTMEKYFPLERMKLAKAASLVCCTSQ